MRLVLIACLSLTSVAATAADKPSKAKPREPIHARTCEGAIAKYRPGAPATLQQLHRLPPAETYAAVYYTDGCPRRLVEAQGRQRR